MIVGSPRLRRYTLMGASKADCVELTEKIYCLLEMVGRLANNFSDVQRFEKDWFFYLEMISCFILKDD